MTAVVRVIRFSTGRNTCPWCLEGQTPIQSRTPLQHQKIRVLLSCIVLCYPVLLCIIEQMKQVCVHWRGGTKKVLTAIFKWRTQWSTATNLDPCLAANPVEFNKLLEFPNKMALGCCCQWKLDRIGELRVPLSLGHLHAFEQMKLSWSYPE